MTDTAAAEAPAESVPLEAAAAPAPEAELETEVNKRAREKVLDHLTDSEGPQTVAEIIQGTGLGRNTAEQAIHRAAQAGQIERVGVGLYKLAPPKPPPPRPEPPAPAIGGRTYEDWMTLMEAWYANPATWDVATLGPAPGQPGCLVPMQASMMFARRLERREKQEAEDFKLLDQLLTACHGNYHRTAALADPRPIHVILNSGVPIEDIISTIRYKVDRRNYPKNQTIGSWSEPWFLKAVSEQYARRVLAPRWVKRWQSRLAGPPMAEAAKTAQQKAVDASEPSPAIQPAPEQESASAVPPAQPDRLPEVETVSVSPEEPDQMAPSEPTRDSILAAFARNRVPPQPAPQPQPVPQPRPPQRQAEPEPISEEGWEEIIAGFMAGTVNWNVRRLGPEPGQPGCRAPRHILRSFRL